MGPVNEEGGYVPTVVNAPTVVATEKRTAWLESESYPLFLRIYYMSDGSVTWKDEADG